MEDREQLKLLLTLFMEQRGLLAQNCNGTPIMKGVDDSLPIAETTIVTGAGSLEMAKQLIQERYSDVVDVVYGDTDSVFLKTVENLSVADAIKSFSRLSSLIDRLGDKISKEVSTEFPDPVFLEFEKVLFPSLLVNRKA